MVIRMASGTALAVALGAANPAWAQSSPSPYMSAERYDVMGRLTGTIAPDPDGAGPLGHAAVRNSFDQAGRLSRVEHGELATWQSESIAPASWSGFTVHRVVDILRNAAGLKVRETVSSGGTIYGLTQFSYDATGRLECTAVRMNLSVAGSLPASACDQSAPGAQGPDRITRHVYDAAGQLLKVQKAVGTPLVQDYATYSYSANGLRTEVVDANSNKASLEYDGHGRQIRWRFPSKTTPGVVSSDDYEEYAYDPNGNRTSLRKRDGQTLTYSYDALNRVTVKTPSAGQSTHYGYDLRGLQLYARFNSASGEGVTNSYDGFGRQVSSTTTEVAP